MTRASLVLPVVSIALVAQVFAVLLVRLFGITNTSLGAFAPFGTSTIGSLATSLSVVLPMAVAAFFFVWLTRRKRLNFLKAILISLTTLSCFLLSFVTFELVFNLWQNQFSDLVALLLAITAATLIAYVGFRPLSKLSVVAVIVLSTEIGGFLAMIIPVPTIFLLPTIVSIYDVYAVFRGPLGKLVDLSDKEILAPVAASIGDVQIGLGDLAFYAMVAAKAFQLVTFQLAMLTLVAINIGIIVTLILTLRRRTLPGLPVPMLLGVVTLFLAWFLSQ